MFKQEKSYYKRSFFVALIMAAVMFAPFVIIDKGFFIFYGDYNAQQIPFFKMCVQAIHDGWSGWDWHTDLGANFVGSYTYYTLGSPFFWFMTLFPAAWSHYLMAPLLCVKIALFSLFAFIYIRRFVAKPQTALIGGILYAFSSFNLYNIFFQFQDAIIWFPLLLVALEEAVINKRRGFFALAVALNALANYFFFIGECVFLVIYVLCRFGMDKRFSIKLKGFLALAFESVVGVLIAGVLFIPSIYQVLDVPRSTRILTDWNFLFYGNEQRYGLLLEGIFFPPEVSAKNHMFTEANAKWSSVALYLPLFSMAGVIAFVKGAKGHWARVLLPICIGMSFVPGLNASFTLFNNNFYTRWWYMPELICCLATVYALEHEEFDYKAGIRTCAWVTAIMAGLAFLAPFTKEITAEDGTKTKELYPRFMLSNMAPVLWVMLGIGVAFLVMLWLLIHVRKKLSPSLFMRRVTSVTILCSMVLGYYFLGYGRIINGNGANYQRMVNAKFEIDDTEFYRIEGINETNNVNMLWGMSSLKSFTSIIPGSTFELYDLLGISRTVNSAPENNRYALRAFARVKYVMIPNSLSISSRENIIADLAIYEYMDTQGEYEIYKTDYALPMGFSYDTYLAVDDVKSNKRVDNLLVRAAVLTEEQIEKYSDILEPEDVGLTGVINILRFKVDAAKRIEGGVSDFAINRNGFTASSNYDSEKLVVFSVPYCKGWSAAVNGNPVEVDKINGGLCGIRVPAGEASIVFTYETPGLKYGIYASIIGIVLLGVYMLVLYVVLHKRPTPYVHLYDIDQHEGVLAHRSYVRQISEQIYGASELGGRPPEQFLMMDLPKLSEELSDEDRKEFTARVEDDEEER